MIINDSFKKLIPPLTPDEYAQLEANCLADGIRDPLVVWQGVLIDGHNRLAIAEKHGLDYTVVEKEFQDEDGAMQWMCANQLGRRNLAPEQRSYLIGVRYNLENKGHGGDRNSSGKNFHLKTDEKLAEEYNLSPKSVRNNAQFAHGIDAIAGIAPELSAEILQGKTDITQKEVQAIATDIKQAEKEIRQTAFMKPVEVVEREVEEKKAEIVANRINIALLHMGDEESYTPIKYLESARAVMGGIDLDPASNEMAQSNVKAGTYYTVDDNGLTKPWSGKVWMNPPYTARVINEFLAKAVKHFNDKEVTEAIILTNNNTDTSWFHNTAMTAAAVCFTAGRINFLKRDGSKSSPTNGQVFFYLGNNANVFAEEFSQYGMVMVKI